MLTLSLSAARFVWNENKNFPCIWLYKPDIKILLDIFLKLGIVLSKECFHFLCTFKKYSFLC